MTIRKWMAALTVAVGILSYHAEAQAACTSHTVMTGDGKIIFCTTCCQHNHCTTNCL